MTTNSMLIYQGLNDLLDSIQITPRGNLPGRRMQGHKAKEAAIPKLSISIPVELRDKLRSYCESEGEVLSHLVERAIILWLLIRANRVNISQSQTIERSHAPLPVPHSPLNDPYTEAPVTGDIVKVIDGHELAW